jgi:hypothetical protein
MDETAIAALVQAEIADATSFDQADKNADRVRAIEYYRGEMNDLVAEEGRSQVVDHTVQDVIGWTLPGLMRVFFSGDELVHYDPVGPEDEQAAKQATDYVNHIVLKECPSYQVMWDAFHDALLHRNGVLKHFWDHSPQTKTQMLSCLTEDQMAELVGSDQVEVLEHTERPPQMVMSEAGPQQVVYHDLKIKVEVSKGKLTLAAVAPENFLINRDAIDIDTARFYGERLTKTRSELVEMGFDRDEVEELASEHSIDADEVRHARLDDSGMDAAASSRETEEIEIFEVYPLADIDGDGIAERLKVIAAGQNGTTILDWETWEDDSPYSDLTPERVPHRWSGRSIFDDTEDIQRIKTALQRQLLDNLYQSNIPDRVVNAALIENPDALFDRKIGNVIRAKGNPVEAVFNLEVPFTAAQSFQALEYMDMMVEKRTGVSKSSMALDPETLQNQTATAANIQQTASYSKIELIARNFAEMGLKHAFRAILKLVVKHQDRPRTIRLRNKWVEMDPSGWNADMDVTVNVGLGSGSRDRDMMLLTAVLEQQKAVLLTVGGAASTYGKKISKAILYTMQKMVEASGLKGPDTYFPDMSDEELQEIAKAAAESNPEAQKAQAQLQIEQVKAQAQAAIKQQEMQAQSQLDQQKMQQNAAIEKVQAEADVAVKQRDTEAQIALKEREFQHKAELDQRNFEFDKQLKLLDVLAKNAGPKPNGSGKDGKGTSPGMSVDELIGAMQSIQQASGGGQMPMIEDKFDQLARLIAAPYRLVRDEQGRPFESHKVLPSH